MLQPISEVARLESFSPLPHAIAVDGNTLYVSSRATRNIDVIARDSWKKIDEIVPPGMPWGMTYGDGAIVMTCGESDDDNRRIRHYVPGSGFGSSFIACPDDTGSHLAVWHGYILLGQWYNKVVLVLNQDGTIHDRIAAPHGVAGVAVAGDALCLLGTDDEDHGEYYLSRMDLAERSEGFKDIATVPFHARGLFYDGVQWWTNHREADRIVAFTFPTLS